MVPSQQCKVVFRIPHYMKYTRDVMPLKMLSVSCLFGPGHPSESVILYSAHWALKPSPLILFTVVTNCWLLALFSSLVLRRCSVTVLQDIKKLWPIWLLILFIGLVLWIMKPGVFDFCWANSFSCMIWQTWKKTKSHSDSHCTTYCICFEIWSSLVQNKRLPRCWRQTMRLVNIKYVQIWENLKKRFRCFVVVAYKDQVLFDTGTDWHSSIEGHITVWRWVSAQKCIAEMGDPKVSLKPIPDPFVFF